MINSIYDLILMHNSSGNIEDGYKYIHLDKKTFVINTYTLRVRKGNTTKEETRKWNMVINNEIKKDRNLHKEVREFVSVFELFSKLGIKTGRIEKTETPDFVHERDGVKTGIEITKIYVGNDWVAEKISEEIKQFKLRKSELQGYIEYKKFQNRITTFGIRGGIVIMPLEDNVSFAEYFIEIKNKIFEKVRKLIDEYAKHDKNIIYVDVVSPIYFENEEDVAKLNEEIKFYVQHLEENFDDREYEIVMKTGNDWTSFDIKNGTYERL